MHLVNALHKFLPAYRVWNFPLHRVVPVLDIADRPAPPAVLAQHNEMNPELLREPHLTHEPPGIVGEVVGELAEIVFAIYHKFRVVHAHIVADNKL